MGTSRWSVIALVLVFSAKAGAADEVVIADFEGKDYGAWVAEGEAMGAGPARGTLANQQRVSGFMGEGLVNTYLKGDASKGRLTSPEFRVERRYVNFLIGGGNRPGEAEVQLLVEGKVVRSETGADDEKLDWATWDVAEFAGKMARVRIVDEATGGWGHVNVDQIVMSDERRAEPRAAVRVVSDVLYDETYRPQFHFTSKRGWLNDPNGLVYYDGNYHLFFQHNPKGTEWGNMTWGHAVSSDLFRWRQVENAIEPDALGTAFSGSAVIDWENTAGFGKQAMVCVYTSAGKPFTQSIAYSVDGGRTFKKYEHNPVLRNISDGNRDPKVMWHAPTKRWVMALYVDQKNAAGKTVQTISFYGSPDLKEWTYLSRLDGFFECPDFFELQVDGDAGRTKWVAFAADGAYVIGTFDGTTFTREAGPFRGHFGSSFYAAQTYSDLPREDGRRILIGWMRGGKYPRMPFNQQMSVPMELTLRTTPEGVRMFKWPAREIASLEAGERTLSGDEAKRPIAGELLDLEATFEVGATTTAVGLDVRGMKVRWTRDEKLSVGSSTTEMKEEGGKVRLRVLLDRASVEVFGNGGAAMAASCFLPRGEVKVITEGDAGVEVKVRKLKSVWK